ncbi:MAG: creatininase family protein [Caldilineaceae bacterium]|nr:creatininase family protein [Caldilineaceae bacterium]MCB9151414.1 creatininase family protein [Caldilineaceae bacterium]
MRWEELTGDQFVAAVDECEGVCLIALSVVERHGHHLPMGTDMYEGRGILERVAAQEKVILFPDYIFTQIPEARHLAGTISIDGDLMIQLLDNVCREIARNGLKKIVFVNAHGGNNGLVAFYNMRQLYKPSDYVVYLVNPFFAAFGSELQLPWPREEDGHAGPGETSMMRALRPDLVNMELVPDDDEGKARNRLAHLREAGVQTGIWWYADHPTHYAGNAAHATAEAGEQMLDVMAAAVVRAVRAIKADTEAKRLQDEFFARSGTPSV